MPRTLLPLVEKVTFRLEEFAKQRDADKTRGPLTGEQLRVLASACPKQIILTGPVGQSLGLMLIRALPRPAVVSQ